MAVVAAFVVSAVVAAAGSVAPLAWLHPRHRAACLLVLAEQRLMYVPVAFLSIVLPNVAALRTCTHTSYQDIGSTYM